MRRIAWAMALGLVVAMAGIVGLVGLVGSLGVAQAQTWPVKPIRWIVPFPPGGPADVTARLIVPRLSERLGQTVIIDNRPGANSNIGYEAAARAAPDGYTMLFAVAGLVSNPHLYKLSWDPLKDFTPVAQLNQLQILVIASSRFGPSTLQEVIDYARAKPGALKCAWGGSILMGLVCETFRIDGRLDVTVVPYKGSAPAMNDLIGGQVDIMADVINTALPQIKSGRAKPIALTNPARGRAPFPDLPVLADALNGFDMLTWQGIVMPAGTPPEIVNRMNREVGAVQREPELHQRIVESGLEVVTATPEAFGALMRRDYERFGRIIRAANIKVD